MKYYSKLRNAEELYLKLKAVLRLPKGNLSHRTSPVRKIFLNGASLRDKSLTGFTLVEVLITVSIFSVVIGSLLSMLVSQNTFFSQCIGKFDVSRMTRKAMTNIVKELRTSDTLTVTIYDRPMDQAGASEDVTNGKSIEFQVPVDWDGDDDYIDEYGRVEWGAEGQKEWSIEYCWDSSTNEVLRRVWNANSVLEEQVVISPDITDFTIKGYCYDSATNNYVISTSYEIIEIDIKGEKTQLGGRTLSFPLEFALNNRVFCRN